MKFEVSAEIDYTTFEPCTFVLNIHALSRPQRILRESFIVEPYTFWEEISPSAEGNRLVRITITNPGNIHFSYRAQVENAFTVIDCQQHTATPIAELAPKVFTYLHPSRYCQSDRLYRFANHQFGNIENEFAKVLEVTEWIHRNVEYLSGSTNAETSAYDTVTQQAGVCRDFAHLGIALCRALTIPARYCSVYAYQLEPQDFHACFEAYLTGRWIIFDATKLVPLNGLIKIAVGRDAADTAIANLFGNIASNSMQVNSLLIEGTVDPIYYDPSKWTGICYG